MSEEKSLGVSEWSPLKDLGGLESRNGFLLRIWKVWGPQSGSSQELVRFGVPNVVPLENLEGFGSQAQVSLN